MIDSMSACESTLLLSVVQGMQHCMHSLAINLKTVNHSV